MIINTFFAFFVSFLNSHRFKILFCLSALRNASFFIHFSDSLDIKLNVGGTLTAIVELCNPKKLKTDGHKVSIINTFNARLFSYLYVHFSKKKNAGRLLIIESSDYFITLLFEKYRGGSLRVIGNYSTVLCQPDDVLMFHYQSPTALHLPSFSISFVCL